jgi:von Willebrand factor type D domain
MVLVGCGAQPTPTASNALATHVPTPPPEASPSSPLSAGAWEELRRRRLDAGGVTPELALVEFATLIGAVPGVEPVAGALPARISGTMAARHVAAFLDQYTPLQRAVIEEFLYGSIQGTPPRESERVNGVLALGPPVAQAVNLQARINEITIELEHLWSRPIRPVLYSDMVFDPVVDEAIARDLDDFLSGQADDPDRFFHTGAYTRPAFYDGLSWLWAQEGEGDDWTCVITLGPSGFELEGALLDELLAHEIAHCLQFEVMGLSSVYDGVSDWLVEGSAEWIGTAYVQGATGPNVAWNDYFLDMSLFDRHYDAIGFFAHLTDVGLDPWDEFVPAYETRSGPTAFAAMTTGEIGVRFLDTWPLSRAMSPDELGPEWTTQGPGLPSDVRADASNHINDWTETVDAGEQALMSLYFPDAAAARITASGYGGLEWAPSTTHFFGGSWEQVFTFDDQTRCPNGQPIPSAVLAESRIAFAGLTGSTDGATFTAEEVELDDICQEQGSGPPPPLGSGQQGPASATSASTTGDTHADTFDDLRYDLQLVGEFVLVRSTEGDLEVQARQVPVGAVVAANAAVAVRVGGDRVGIYEGDPARLLVNGIETPVEPSGIELAGGGTVVSHEGVVVVAWPDGSTLEVDTGFQPDPIMRLAPARQGQVVGLWGDFDGDPVNDLTARDGTVVDRYADQRLLYDSFANSWRLTTEESLFDYQPGESTATFTDLTFPHEIVTIDDLDASAVDNARGVCRAAGVIEADVFEDCVLDVALTGDVAYATAAARVRAGTQRVTLSPQFETGNDLRAEIDFTADGRPVVAYALYGSDVEPDTARVMLTVCQDPVCGSTTTRELVSGGDDWLARLAVGPDDRPVVAATNQEGATLIRCADPLCETTQATNPAIGEISEMDLDSAGLPWLLDQFDERIVRCMDPECDGMVDIDLSTAGGDNGTVIAHDIAVPHDDRPQILTDIWTTDEAGSLSIARCQDERCSALDVVELANAAEWLPTGKLRFGPNDEPYVTAHYVDSSGVTEAEGLILCGDPLCAEHQVQPLYEGPDFSNRIASAAVGDGGRISVVSTTLGELAMDEWRLLECLDLGCGSRTEISAGPVPFVEIVTAGVSPNGQNVIVYESEPCSEGDPPGCGVALLIPASQR